MDHLGDAELFASTPRRPEAFAVFYRRHERMVLGYFMRRLGDAELAADLTAETFAAALSASAGSIPRAARPPPGSWGSRATSSAARWRSGASRIARGAGSGMPPIALEEEAMTRIERLGGDDRAAALLERLPADQAEAVRARIVEELPYKIIAAEVRCSESVIRQRVSRGLATLRSIAKESP